MYQANIDRARLHHGRRAAKRNISVSKARCELGSRWRASGSQSDVFVPHWIQALLHNSTLPLVVSNRELTYKLGFLLCMGPGSQRTCSTLNTARRQSASHMRRDQILPYHEVSSRGQTVGVVREASAASVVSVRRRKVPMPLYSEASPIDDIVMTGLGGPLTDRLSDWASSSMKSTDAARNCWAVKIVST